MSQNRGADPKGSGSGKSKAKKGGKAGVEEKREDVLQAVIIADSFQDRFLPFTTERPRCLLPLGNTPLIEYTLEFLALNSVQEVILYTANYTDEIERYIHDSPRWSPTSPVNPFSALDLIRVSDAHSMGDFLRDLDKRSLIAGDFILVHGDLVANISIDAALAAHKARRAANGDAMMTMVLRAAGDEDHRTKSHAITPVFVVESSTGRCLQYEETNPLQEDRHMILDDAVFEHDTFEVRSDLIDCGIDICTPDALALWSESFDYELPRKNFLHSVLKDWELNGKMIFADIVETGYAARAHNLQSYDAISQNVLARWTYPFVPDSDLAPGQSYKSVEGGVYRGKGVEFEANSKVTRSAIGARTTIGSGSTVSNSFIGSRCFIGKNVKIRNSYIWDDTTIEDGATVTKSIIAASATVAKNSIVPEGSLISFNVYIGRDITLPPAAVISLQSKDRKLVESDAKLLGPKGRGAMFKYRQDDDDDDGNEDFEARDPENLQRSLLYSVKGFSLSTSSVSTLSSDVESVSEDEATAITAPEGLGHGGDEDHYFRSRLSSFNSDDDAVPMDIRASFHTEAVNGLLDALRADDAQGFDGAKLEFMGLRLSHDASDSSVRRAVAAAFVRRSAELIIPSIDHDILEPAKAAEKVVVGKDGTPTFLREVGVGSGTSKEQVDFILALQKAAVGQTRMHSIPNGPNGVEAVTPAPEKRNLEPARAGTLLAALLQHMYSEDVIEEEGIMQWWQDKRASEGESMTAVRERCKALVDWLETADDESSSSEEDESE